MASERQEEVIKNARDVLDLVEAIERDEFEVHVMRRRSGNRFARDVEQSEPDQLEGEADEAREGVERQPGIQREALMLLDLGIDQVTTDGFQTSKGSNFVDSHEAAVTDNIGDQDRC